MRPPICDLCGERISGPGGGLVSFLETPHDKAINKRFEEPGFVGHPANLFWFCQRHLPAAQALAHLRSAEAFAKLRELPGQD